MQSFIVEKIEFDFTDSFGTITEQEQEFITDNTLGVWHVTEEDELVDFITGDRLTPQLLTTHEQSQVRLREISPCRCSDLR